MEIGKWGMEEVDKEKGGKGPALSLPKGKRHSLSDPLFPFFPFSLFPFPPSIFPFLSSLFLFLFAVQFFLAGCTALPNLPLLPTPTTTAIPQPTATATPAPTATRTPIPTPTPVVVILKTPRPRDRLAPEPMPAGALIAYSAHLDFYAEPDSFWAQRIGDIGPAIEGELRRVAGRLQADLPKDPIPVSIQAPSTSPLVRGMDCPARGLYYNSANGNPLLTIFADENTSRVQVLAVAAHELAHHLTSGKLGEGGDILLNEGLANWASRDTWSAWQGWPSFAAAVRDYRARNIYLPLEETLTFDPSMARELGLADCFTLRDLRYNEWASFVDYLINRYGFDIITQLWQATPDDQHPSRQDRRAEPMATVPARRRVPPGQPLPSRPDRATTVDYAGVLGKELQELEQDWLESLYRLQARRGIRNTQYLATVAHAILTIHNWQFAQ